MGPGMSSHFTTIESPTSASGMPNPAVGQLAFWPWVTGIARPRVLR